MAVSPNNRLADLTNALIAKTDDGTINWDKTSIQGLYSSNLGSYVVNIDQISDGVNVPDYRISLYNQFGDFIESYKDTDLSGLRAHGYDGFFAAMESLYHTAARQASGADKAIDDIIRFLNS